MTNLEQSHLRETFIISDEISYIFSSNCDLNVMEMAFSITKYSNFPISYKIDALSQDASK